MQVNTGACKTIKTYFFFLRSQKKKKVKELGNTAELMDTRRCRKAITLHFSSKIADISLNCSTKRQYFVVKADLIADNCIRWCHSVVIHKVGVFKEEGLNLVNTESAGLMCYVSVCARRWCYSWNGEVCACALITHAALADLNQGWRAIVQKDRQTEESLCVCEVCMCVTRLGLP